MVLTVMYLFSCVSAILPPLASLGIQPVERTARKFPKQWKGEQRFLTPSTRRPIERTANQVSERVLNWLTLCSLAAVAEIEHSSSGSTEFLLGQFRTFSRSERCRFNWSASLARVSRNQHLPAIAGLADKSTADRFRRQTPRPIGHRVQEGMPAARTQDACEPTDACATSAP